MVGAGVVSDTATASCTGAQYNFSLHATARSARLTAQAAIRYTARQAVTASILCLTAFPMVAFPPLAIPIPIPIRNCRQTRPTITKFPRITTTGKAHSHRLRDNEAVSSFKRYGNVGVLKQHYGIVEFGFQRKQL